MILFDPGEERQFVQLLADILFKISKGMCGFRKFWPSAFRKFWHS